jgi:predicted TIM-barrel fold metal-dependent hydrolase
MTQRLDRRDFLTRMAALPPALALASTLPSAAAGAEDEKKVLPIIDTHQHLWDLKKFKLPWLARNKELARSYLMADYLAAADEVAKLPVKPGQPPARIVKTVYMEVDVAPEQQQAEADYVIDICKEGKSPMMAAVISGRPNSEGFAGYIKPLGNSPYIKGVRQVLHGPDTPAGYCLDPKFIKGIQLLGDLGLSFDLCVRAAELPDFGKLVDACPETRFILDHCGNPDVKVKDHKQWKKDVVNIARRKNVVCKVSGIVASAKPGAWTAEDLAPIVNHVLDTFGPDRVVFGGDWPVCTLAARLAQWVGALRAIVSERKYEEQRKLFHDNAVRVYRLG